MEEPRRLGGRYELGTELGRGGMAEVHIGHDIRLGRSVAVKTLRADLARDPTFQARFRREAQSAASLNHPSIVAVYDTGEDYVDGISLPYIVMEYVDGSTLRDLLHSGRRLLPERALEMTAGVLQALEYSHRNGIVHRDIKPANVMLTRNGTVKVMDFGIARAMADTGGSTMTQTSSVIGTAQYLSPEQARGETVDTRSDLYSTGCLVYELLTLRPPFVGDTPVSVAYQHVREEPQPPSAFDTEVTPPMDAVVLKSLAKSPDHRYQTADEFRADLERALDGLQVEAPMAMGAAGYDPAYGQQAAMQQQGGTSMLPPVQEDYRADEGHGRRKKKSPASTVLLVIAALIVLVGAIFLAKFFMSSGTSNETTAPAVVGHTMSEARTLANNAGVDLSKAGEKYCDKPKHKVCQQTPKAEEKVKKNSTVRVWVSKGARPVAVPPVTGKKFAEARDLLHDKGFQNVGRKDQETTDQEPDTVISADPASGSKVVPGKKITLTVAKKPEQKPVPSVVNMPRDAAEKKITDAGFTPKIQQEENPDAPSNVVIEQDPKGEQPADPGAEVTLTVTPEDNGGDGGDESDNPDDQGQDEGDDQNQDQGQDEGGDQDQGQDEGQDGGDDGGPAGNIIEGM